MKSQPTALGKKFMRTTLISLLIAETVMLSVGFLLYYYKEQIILNYEIVLFAFVVIVYVVIVFAVIINVVKRKNIWVNERKYNQYLEERLKTIGTKNCDSSAGIDAKENSCSATIDNAIDKTNIISLMLKNAEETTEYFCISKKQAKRSFLLASLFSIVGLASIIGAIIIFIYTDKFESGLVTTIFSAIVEGIAATAFWIHSKSIDQLNYYYEALHENECFLSAINIVDSLSVEKRDDMYIEIIRKQLSNIGDRKCSQHTNRS